MPHSEDLIVMAKQSTSTKYFRDKPLPHPKYNEEYILPKTRYGVPVRAEQFHNNRFDYRGWDREDDGTRWWEAQWAKDKEIADREKEEREAKGETAQIDRSQVYIPRTQEEKEAALWYQETREYERCKKQRKKEAAERAAERLAAEKQWWKQEDLKARLAEEAKIQAAEDAVRAGKRSPTAAWWKILLLK